MTNCLLSIKEATELIGSGAKLLLAGEEAVLDQMPLGRWIGGTTAYFMTESGCCEVEDKVFATELPDSVIGADIVVYDIATIKNVAQHTPECGVTFLIAPSFSNIVRYYAENAPGFPGMFMKPIAGWISGVQPHKIGGTKPKVFDGTTGMMYDNGIVALHARLSPNLVAKIDFLNLFEPGDGPAITFPEATFKPKECYVDGVKTSLAQYIANDGIDVSLPLVTNLCGAIINSSIATVNQSLDVVALYAPVFPGYEYRFAKPIGDYTTQFLKRLPNGSSPVFCCNCIHNYMYCDLEGKSLGVSGPLTYGEIAYQMLNRTMVYVDIVPKS